MDTRLYKAMAFGEDGLTGDSGSSPSRDLLVDATEDSTFEELLELWARRVAEVDLGGTLNMDGTVTLQDDDGEDWVLGGEELVEHVCDEDVGLAQRPVGFWLLTDEAVETVFLLESVEAYGDTEAYVLLRAMKTIANRLASKTVGDVSAIEGSA